MNVLEKLIFYWNYPFVRYALIVGVLIALCSSLLGVTLVLKRFSFIGDGLSHVAFGGMATGANLHQELPLPLPENSNFFRYVGGASVRRHAGSERVGVDVSDVVLAEQVTNVVSENNYLRIGHHLAAKGDFTWLQIGHKLFGRKDAAEPWWATSAAVKQTPQYVAAQLD